MLNPSPRLLAAIAAGVLLLVAILFLPQCVSSLLSSKQEARTAKGQAGASIESGAEATNTMGNVMAADAAVDQQVKGARDEIRSQPAGHSNDAAVRAACRLRSHVNSERCAALRRADSGRAARGGAER
jgi:hypothetical protein